MTGGGCRKRLYIEGHHVRRGYAVALEGVGPVRFYQTRLRRVWRIVDRFNALQALAEARTSAGGGAAR